MSDPRTPEERINDPDAWVPYRYIPSKPAALVFVVLFSITTLYHLFQVFRKRTWYFIPLVIGGILEVAGFVGRILNNNDYSALGPFIMQSICLLVAPALFAASIYIILGRIILLVDGERYSFLRQRRLTAVFVTGDVLSFQMQSGGGGIQAMKSISAMHIGEKIIVTGLFLQLVFFSLFIAVAGTFHYRLLNDKPVKKHLRLRFWKASHPSHRRLTTESTAPIYLTSAADINNLPWKRHIYTLYITSILILIRSIFRVIEYIQGNNGYLLRKEVFLYVFDAALMFVVMVMFNWIHPSQVTELYQKRINGEGVAQPEVELHSTGKNEHGATANGSHGVRY